jgi:hypothetical protein
MFDTINFRFYVTAKLLKYQISQFTKQTCATVCSPIGMSSFRRDTRYDIAMGSDSRMILHYNKRLGI